MLENLNPKELQETREQQELAEQQEQRAKELQEHGAQARDHAAEVLAGLDEQEPEKEKAESSDTVSFGRMMPQDHKELPRRPTTHLDPRGPTRDLGKKYQHDVSFGALDARGRRLTTDIANAVKNNNSIAVEHRVRDLANHLAKQEGKK